MPMYDRQCDKCGVEKLDCLEKFDTPNPACDCGGQFQRVWKGHSNAVIGDEIDVWIKNGLCNDDGSPKHYTSRSSLRRDELKKGYTNYVEHKGSRGSDKSPHTSRWV